MTQKSNERLTNSKAEYAPNDRLFRVEELSVRNLSLNRELERRFLATPIIALGSHVVESCVTDEVHRAQYPKIVIPELRNEVSGISLLIAN